MNAHQHNKFLIIYSFDLLRYYQLWSLLLGADDNTHG